jgi:hypothetical protein
MNDVKEMQEMFQNQMKAFLPQVTVNKNGYEIRTQILELAKEVEFNDYNAKLGQFETKVERDGDEVVTTVTMPTVPGTEQILESAQKFYDFVNKR